MNQRKAQLELVARSGKSYPFPFAKLIPRPSSKDRLVEASVDDDLGGEAVTYALTSGAEGSVHIEHALEYNQEPRYLAELLAHKLTVEALEGPIPRESGLEEPFECAWC